MSSNNCVDSRRTCDAHVDRHVVLGSRGHVGHVSRHNTKRDCGSQAVSDSGHVRYTSWKTQLCSFLTHPQPHFRLSFRFTSFMAQRKYHVTRLCFRRNSFVIGGQILLFPRPDSGLDASRKTASKKTDKKTATDSGRISSSFHSSLRLCLENKRQTLSPSKLSSAN